MSNMQQQIFSKVGVSSTVPTGRMRPTETFGLQLHDPIITYGSNKMKCKRIVEVNCYSIMLVCTAESNTNCYGAQRRLFLHLCLTASSCASGDQYFNTSVIHSLNAAIKSNINGLP